MLAAQNLALAVDRKFYLHSPPRRRYTCATTPPHGGTTMPWTMADAPRHTKKADTAKEKKQWAAVANSVLSKTKNKARAVASANAVVKQRGGK